MFIVVQHHISNPQKFQEAVQSAKMPDGIKLHSSLPNEDYTEAVCLWEANELEEVKNVVESSVGQFSKNDYFEVESKKQLGCLNKMSVVEKSEKFHS